TDVRFGSKADISTSRRDGRFTLKSGHSSNRNCVLPRQTLSISTFGGTIISFSRMRRSRLGRQLLHFSSNWAKLTQYGLLGGKAGRIRTVWGVNRLLNGWENPRQDSPSSADPG